MLEYRLANVARLGLVSRLVFVAFYFEFGGPTKAKVSIVAKLSGS